MKPERIEELLKGTKYEHKKSGWVPEAHSIAERLSGLAILPQAHEDAELNAARVQLLAKALREIVKLVLDSDDKTEIEIKAVFLAGKALTEAGLNEQKEG